MSAPGKTALSRNYEEILERRAELLSDVRSRHQQNHQREEPLEIQTAVERNRRLLEDVRKTEELLSQMTDPHLLSLETQYWVSVEAQIPTWQGSLLGTSPAPGPSPGPDPACPPRKGQQRSAAAKDPSRPPLPRPRGPL